MIFPIFISALNMYNIESYVIVQLKGSGAELSRRVQNLLAVTQAHGISGAGMHLPGSTKIHDQSLADLKEVRLGNSHGFG